MSSMDIFVMTSKATSAHFIEASHAKLAYTRHAVYIEI
jgi:hypothetical protein